MTTHVDDAYGQFPKKLYQLLAEAYLTAVRRRLPGPMGAFRCRK